MGKPKKEVALGNIATRDVSRLQCFADMECAFARVPENAPQTYSVSLNFSTSDAVAFSDIRAMTDSYLAQAF
jgi:hypothetical protein